MRHLYIWSSVLAIGPLIALARPLMEHENHAVKIGWLERRADVNIKDMFPEFDPKEHSHEQSPEAAQKCLEDRVKQWFDSAVGVSGVDHSGA